MIRDHIKDLRNIYYYSFHMTKYEILMLNFDLDFNQPLLCGCFLGQCNLTLEGSF